ncbi:MAG: hypothetical protein AABX45_02295 [Nanoarchaeota archaeon]
MKPIKNFNDFLKEGIVKKQSPDLSRANFLIKESQKSYFFVNSLIKNLGLNDDNANSIIKLCYDIIMGFIRAKMLKYGYNAVGQGAHEAEVSYLRSIGFNENDVQFADQLRYFRNGIMYYGKMFDKEYAKQVLNFLNKIINKLK